MLLNQTNLTEEELKASFSCPSLQDYHFLAVVWGSLVCVIGTVGNLLTIVTFASDSHLRTRFNVLIVNLAVADLLYCALLQPITVDSYLHLRWRSGALWCQTFGLLLFISYGVSIITLCLIAVSRYLLVARNSLFQLVFSNRGLVLLLTFTWTFAVASFSPLWSVYTFVPQVCTCSFHRTRGRPYISVVLSFYFLGGLLCVGVFYLLIYRQVRISAETIHRYRLRRSSGRKPTAVLVVDGTNCGGITGSCRVELGSPTSQGQTHLDWTNLGRNEPDWTKQAHTDQNQTKLEQPGLGRNHVDQTNLNVNEVGWAAPPSTVLPNEAPPPTASSPPTGISDVTRVTRMCFIVLLCFVSCFLPFLIIVLDKHNSAPPVLHMLCANLVWLNSCINPLLYVVTNRQFQRAYFVLLTKAATPFTCLWTRLSASY